MRVSWCASSKSERGRDEEGVVITTEKMREVDRLTIEKYRIVLRQTMENDGRSGAALRALVDEKGTGWGTLRTNDV